MLIVFSAKPVIKYLNSIFKNKKWSSSAMFKLRISYDKSLHTFYSKIQRSKKHWVLRYKFLMNHTKLATTKQVNIPNLGVRIIKVKLLHQGLFLGKKLCKLTVNIRFSLQLRALEWYPPAPPQVPVISFLYPKLDPNNFYVPGTLSWYNHL